MFRHRNRPHPWPAAAMRNTKRLVQIQMANIRPDLPRARQPHLRVHVRPIHVHLPPMFVHDPRKSP